MNGLQIANQTSLVKMTKGQTELLKTIKAAVSLNQPLTLADIVIAYTSGVRRKYTGGYYSTITDRFSYENVDILEEFKKDTNCWIYRLRGLIKQWFLTTIGTLVIKNKLIILPVIEID